MVCVYSDNEIDQILTQYRNLYVESKSVELFGVFISVFELAVF